MCQPHDYLPTGHTPATLTDWVLDYPLLETGSLEPWTTGPDLSAYPALQGLSLAGHALETLDFLRTCPGLRRLDISRNGLTDLTGLRHCPWLHMLNLAHNDLRSLADFPRLPHLRSLSLSGNRALRHWQDLRAVSPDLKMLYVKQIGIPDWSFALEWSHLEAVYLSARDLQSLKPLGGLSSLHTLHIHARECTSVANFPSLFQLRHLTLTGAVNLSDASPLADFRGLESLSLSATGVTDVSWVTRLPNLRQLDLRGTPAADNPQPLPAHLIILR
ncbi:MAG: hypothetical protein KF690_10990 [Bacteroidetes bacterium]|nr:hypothetical protein [Bacteroidota bacterium]